GVTYPTAGWNRISWRIGLNHCETGIVRSGDVNGEAPVKRHETRLMGIGKADLDDAVVAYRRWIRRVHPHGDFITVRVARDAHVAFSLSSLTGEIQVAVEQLDALESACSGAVPRDRDVVVGRDVET